MARDYYEVLGVQRDATSDQVRRAYRKQAKAHHPDVNNGEAQDDEAIKEINEAYEVLKDPQKRAAYDRFGHAGVRGSGGGVPPGGVDIGDLGDIFEQFFGFGGRSRQARPRTGPVPERGADMRVRLKLQLEEAVFGATKQVEVVRRETCESCGGDGAAEGSSPVRCDQCDGTGQVRKVQQSVIGSFVNVHTCPKCQGQGFAIETPCPSCLGRGRIQRPRTLEVDVPAGVERGIQIRLSGEGEHGRYGGAPGDLFIAIDVAEHPRFRREGDALHVEVRLNPADAALGAEVLVPSLDGERTLRVPPGTQSGDALRLTGLGVPRLRGAGRGDLIVTAVVMTPEKLTREQRELLEQLRDTLPRAEVVERDRGSFWDRVRERFT
jgi:molecular chaperone DnaJ